MHPKYVKVEFLEDWMGNPKGSKLTIIETMANTLKARKTVSFVEDTIPDSMVENVLETKTLEEPPQHKMVASPQVKKDFLNKPIKARGRK